jgi:hypothetical protein
VAALGQEAGRGGEARKGYAGTDQEFLARVFAVLIIAALVGLFFLAPGLAARVLLAYVALRQPEPKLPWTTRLRLACVFLSSRLPKAEKGGTA